jgi:hypothetical protein
MTHTLHRQGTPESLAHDFPLHAMPAAGVNKDGATPKLQRFWDLSHKYNPVNSGEGKLGNRFGHELASLRENLSTTTHAVYTDEESLTALLRDLGDADIGMSVTLSGLESRLFACCAKAGIKPYAIEHSLKILGDTSALPDVKVMEITTMCGHAMVSRGLIGILAEKIKKGEMTPEQAGLELAKPCQCGIFNPVRAARLMEEFCALYSADSL